MWTPAQTDLRPSINCYCVTPKAKGKIRSSHSKDLRHHYPDILRRRCRSSFSPDFFFLSSPEPSRILFFFFKGEISCFTHCNSQSNFKETATQKIKPLQSSIRRYFMCISLWNGLAQGAEVIWRVMVILLCWAPFSPKPSKSQNSVGFQRCPPLNAMISTPLQSEKTFDFRRCNLMCSDNRTTMAATISLGW